LIKELRNAKVELPIGDGDQIETVTMKELGISNPVLINPRRVYEKEIKDPNAEPSGGGGTERFGAHSPAANARDSSGAILKVPRFDFDVRFCWVPKDPSQRRAGKAQEKANTPAQP
jgi:hypothetical protein